MVVARQVPHPVTSSRRSATRDYLAYLHLSDIHFRHQVGGDTWDVDAGLRNELEIDVRRLVAAHDRLDGVLVTGDVAFSGDEHEYDFASEWLSQIASVAGCEEHDIWTVPGNHDVQRREVSSSRTIQDFHAKMRNCQPDEIDEELRRYLVEDKAGGDAYLAPLRQYIAFAAKYDCSITSSKPFWEDAIPIGATGFSLRIRGMTSSLISDERDDQDGSKLVLGTVQARIERRPLTVTMTLAHHPPSWLRDGEAARGVEDSEASAWSERAAGDLAFPGTLRNFLRHVGSGGRARFPLFAEYVVDIEGTRSTAELRQLLERVEASPFSRGTTQRAKTELIRLAIGLDDGAIAELLLDGALSESELPGRRDLSLRVQDIVHQSPDQAWNLARRSLESSNPAIRAGFLNGLARSIDGLELLSRPDEDWDLVLALIQTRPELAGVPGLWRTGPSTQRELITSLRPAASAADILKVLTAILDSGSAEALSLAAEAWPDETTTRILQATVRRDLSDEELRAYRRIVSRNSTTAVAWVGRHGGAGGSAMLLLAESLTIEEALAAAPVGAWLTWAETRSSRDTPPRSVALLLGIALRSDEPESRPLLRWSFAFIHELAGTDRLPDRAWFAVEPALPHLGVIKDWDRCERLRRAAAGRYVEAKWSPTDLPALSTSADTLKRLIKSFRDVDGGKSYVRQHGLE